MSTRSRRDDAKSRSKKHDDSGESSEDKSAAATSSNNKSKAATNGNSKKPDANLVANLESITGLSKSEAIKLLELCGNDIDMAINIQLGGDVSSHKSKSSTAITNGSSKGTKTTASNDYADEEVRAPIPQITEKLVDYDPYAVRATKRSRTVFDGFRDLQKEFSESDDNGASRSKKRSTLAQLFRPPIEIIFNGTFDAAKKLGTKSSRWILLNVQNIEEFECQCLNRDLWSDETIKEIIKANFLFIQIYHDTSEGQKLINYYKIKSYPLVAVIDPRTGEKVIQWTSKLDSSLFCELITNFLSDHELPAIQSEETFDDVKIESNDDSSDTGSVVKGKQPSHNNNDAVNGKQTHKLPNLKHLSFTDRVEATRNGNSDALPKKKLNSRETIGELLKNKPKTLVTNNDIVISDSSSSSDEDTRIKNVKITSNGSKTNKTNINVELKKENNEETKKPVVAEPVASDATKSSNNPPKSSRYETPNGNKDCHLRIMIPSGDRLDFITDGDAKIKLLIDYLRTEGYTKIRYELIERAALISKSDSSAAANQSRNLFSVDHNSTFKQLNLYPRIFLLLQDMSA